MLVVWISKEELATGQRSYRQNAVAVFILHGFRSTVKKAVCELMEDKWLLQNFLSRYKYPNF